MVVVDDDPKVRQLMERAFKAPEFETHAFPTGRAALDRLAEIRPDCVVSDLLMPDMDGERFLRALRGTPGLESVPFVIVSAVRSEARIRGVLDAGASAFMVKPFPLRDLIDKVRTLLAEVSDRVAAGEHEPLRRTDGVPPTVPLAALTAAQVQAKAQSAGLPLASDAPPPAAVRPDASVAPLPRPDQSTPGSRRIDLQSSESGAGFGRYTRVDLRGRSLVVLTEAAVQPKFLVTTVVTEKGQALRKVETALPHPLARDEDREVVRRQVDIQHEGVLQRIEELVLDGVQRRVLWSDQSRSVDPDLLAWAVSALAQLVETEVGTGETLALAARHARARFGARGRAACVPRHTERARAGRR